MPIRGSSQKPCDPGDIRRCLVEIRQEMVLSSTIDAVEFPYGFAKDTQQKYSTVMELFDSIMGKINQKDFDVALIAAGGLSIPIASTIKNMGKLGLIWAASAIYLWRYREKMAAGERY